MIEDDMDSDQESQIKLNVNKIVESVSSKQDEFITNRDRSVTLRIGDIARIDSAPSPLMPSRIKKIILTDWVKMINPQERLVNLGGDDWYHVDSLTPITSDQEKERRNNHESDSMLFPCYIVECLINKDNRKPNPKADIQKDNIPSYIDNYDNVSLSIIKEYYEYLIALRYRDGHIPAKNINKLIELSDNQQMLAFIAFDHKIGSLRSQAVAKIRSKEYLVHIIKYHHQAKDLVDIAFSQLSPSDISELVIDEEIQDERLKIDYIHRYLDDETVLRDLLKQVEDVRVHDAITRKLHSKDKAGDLTNILTKLGIPEKIPQLSASGTKIVNDKLVELNLSYNKLTTIPEDTFHNISSLETLSFGVGPNTQTKLTNLLTTIPSRAFKDLHNLKVLNLNRNRIQSLPEDVFRNLMNLEELYLEGNELTELPPTIFKGLSKLKILKIHANKIKELPVGLFDDLISLEQLILGESNVRTGSGELYEEGNDFTYLPDGIFDSLSNLMVLSIVNIPFNRLDLDSFRNLKSLQYLYPPFDLDVKFPQFSPINLFRIFKELTYIEMRMPPHDRENFPSLDKFYCFKCKRLSDTNTCPSCKTHSLNKTIYCMVCDALIDNIQGQCRTCGTMLQNGVSVAVKRGQYALSHPKRY
jgi:Leucine-rich repeat (LRR) protein